MTLSREKKDAQRDESRDLTDAEFQRVSEAVLRQHARVFEALAEHDQKTGEGRKRNIVLASTTITENLDLWIGIVLDALGHGDALVTDESIVSDFLDMAGKDHLMRRGRHGPSRRVVADPSIAAENEARVRTCSTALGISVDSGDRIVVVAERLRDAQRAALARSRSS